MHILCKLFVYISKGKRIFLNKNDHNWDLFFSVCKIFETDNRLIFHHLYESLSMSTSCAERIDLTILQSLMENMQLLKIKHTSQRIINYSILESDHEIDQSFLCLLLFNKILMQWISYKIGIFTQAHQIYRLWFH